MIGRAVRLGDRQCTQKTDTLNGARNERHRGAEFLTVAAEVRPGDEFLVRFTSAERNLIPIFLNPSRKQPSSEFNAID
jgi:hypothetical protein